MQIECPADLFDSMSSLLNQQFSQIAPMDAQKFSSLNIFPNPLLNKNTSSIPRIENSINSIPRQTF